MGEAHASMLDHDRGRAAPPGSRSTQETHYLKRELDRRLREDPDLLACLEGTLLDGLFVLDLENPDQRWVSPGFWHRLGYDPDDMPDCPSLWQTLINPVDLVGAGESLEAHCRDPTVPLDVVLRCRRGKAGTVWMRCRGMALRDASGNAVRILGSYTDVSAQHRLQIELRDQHAHLSGLLTAAGEAQAGANQAEAIAGIGHWRLQRSTGAFHWSPQLYKIHGVSAESFVPTIDATLPLYHPDDRAAVIAAVTATGRDGRKWSVRARIFYRDGELRHVEMRGGGDAGSDDGVDDCFGVVIDITEQTRGEQALRDANARLQDLVNIDGLTGIANRRCFDEALDREWRAAGRRSSPISIALVDVDRFKQFNDRYGHQAGDIALRSVAEALASVAHRPFDVAARFGGEEFVMLLPETDLAGAGLVAERARAAIEALGMTHAGNETCGNILTVSIGVATAAPTRGRSQSGAAAMVGMADHMLYEAKRFGRNRVVSLDTLRAAPVASAPETNWMDGLGPEQARHARRRRPDLDAIARVAAQLLGTPVGLVSLIGRIDQRFAGNHGFDGIDGTSRDVSFCAHTMIGNEPMVIGDAMEDPRFHANPLVTGAPGIRFYAGAPIVSKRTGQHLGAVCAIDTDARDGLSLGQRALLTDLATTAARLLDQDLA